MCFVIEKCGKMMIFLINSFLILNMLLLMNRFYDLDNVSQKSPNCSQQSGVGGTITSLIGVCFETEGSGRGGRSLTLVGITRMCGCLCRSWTDFSLTVIKTEKGILQTEGWSFRRKLWLMGAALFSGWKLYYIVKI